jgi:hypothetical protein
LGYFNKPLVNTKRIGTPIRGVIGGSS